MIEYTDKLLALYENAKSYGSLFKRKTYEKAFLDFYEEEQELLESISQKYDVLETEEEKEQMVEDVACIYSNMIDEKLNNTKKKSERTDLIMNSNIAMVTYVLPAFAWSKHPFWDKTADRIVEKWNAVEAVTSKIQRSDYETLKNGFSSGPCYITTAVCDRLGKADDCYELTILRRYRDEYLLSTERGRKAVEEYYDIAPTIVKRINNEEKKTEIYTDIYEQCLIPCIHMIEEGKMEECEMLYTEMVRDLQKRYMFS